MTAYARFFDGSFVLKDKKTIKFYWQWTNGKNFSVSLIYVRLNLIMHNQTFSTQNSIAFLFDLMNDDTYLAEVEKKMQMECS